MVVLDHLLSHAELGEVLAAEGLGEETALVPVDRRLDQANVRNPRRQALEQHRRDLSSQRCDRSGPTVSVHNDRAHQLAAGDIRDRAAGGAAVLGARGLLIYAFGIVANIALARLLAPRDFGIFALGMVVVVAGTLLAEGGFGGALIKREEPPRGSELEAIAALQLTVTVAVAATAGVAAIPLGRDVELVFLMALSLPVAILRAPTMVVLERGLEYRLIATADLVEALVFYAAAIGLVAAGLGVWGLAIAVGLRAAAGTATLLAAGPVGFVEPRWSWRDVRPLAGFGLKLQAGSLVTVAREQLVNIG